MKYIICSIIALAIVSVASATDDITARLNTTALAAASTNTTAMQPAYGWQRGDVMAIQGTISGTNAQSGVVIMTLDTSLDSTYWQTSTHSVTLTAGVTGTVTTLSSITNLNGSRWIRVKSMSNTNTTTGGTITINKLAVDISR